MATATAIISKAFRLFDEETDSKYEQDGDKTTALELLNDGYFEVCRETLCSRTTYALTTVSGTREYSLPSDFVAIFEVSCPAEYAFLTPCLYRNIIVNENGFPSEWYLTPDKIGFNLIPDAAYALTLDYFRGPTDDLELADTPSLIPTTWQLRVLPYYVLWKLFAIDKREEIQARAPFWEAKFNEKLAKMKDWFAGEGRYAGSVPSLE
jgi:hypothetical protein